VVMGRFGLGGPRAGRFEMQVRWYNGDKFRDSTIANDEELSAVVNLIALRQFKDHFTFS
jgi:hypothetical protein